MARDEVVQPLLTLRLIWGSLTFSTLIYGFVLLTTGKTILFKVPDSYTALEAIALFSGLLLFVTFNIHEKRIKVLKTLSQKFPFYVLCWALHEVIVVLAFFAEITADKTNLMIYGVNLVLALFGNTMTFPREVSKV